MSSNHSADIAGAGTPAGVVATSAGRGQFPRVGGELGTGGLLPPVEPAAGGRPVFHPPHFSPNSFPAASCAPGVLFEGARTPARNRTGDRYGKMLALRCVGPVHGEAEYVWQCDCGVTVQRKARHVARIGEAANCGCVIRDLRIAQAARRAAKRQAIAKRLEERAWTAEDVDALRRAWIDSAIQNMDLPGRLARTLVAIRAKANALNLGKRPLVLDGKRRAAAQRALVQEARAQQRHRIEALQEELANPVEPEPPGLRETERLVRARMLIQRGISVASVVYGLKLTALELAALKGVR